MNEVILKPNNSSGIQMEDYDTFFKKQCLPKKMRNVDLKLLNLNSRTNATNVGTKMNNEIPKNKKKMIDLKYDLKKLATQLHWDKSVLNNIKKTAGITYKREKSRMDENRRMLSSVSPDIKIDKSIKLMDDDTGKPNHSN